MPAAAKVEPAQNEEALKTLARLLARKRPWTAREVARRMGCSKVIAYRRIRALIKRGLARRVGRVREGSTGPLSAAYGLIDG